MSDYGWEKQLREWEALLEKLGGYERVADLLKRLLHPIAGIRRADPVDDKRGVDFWADRAGARSLGVDVKLREGDYADLLIEFVSNTRTEAPGWTINEANVTDFVLYMWPNSEALVSYPQLRAATLANLPDWVECYPENRNQTTTDGGTYRTRWIAVPDRVVYEAMGLRITSTSLRPIVVPEPRPEVSPGPPCPTCKGPCVVEVSGLNPDFELLRCGKKHTTVRPRRKTA